MVFIFRWSEYQLKDYQSLLEEEERSLLRLNIEIVCTMLFLTMDLPLLLGAGVQKKSILDIQHIRQLSLWLDNL